MPDLPEGLRQRLGIADDADESTALAAIDALTERAQAATTPPPGSRIVEDTVLEELRAQAQLGEGGAVLISVHRRPWSPARPTASPLTPSTIL